MQTKTSVPSVLNILASFCSNKKSKSSATGGCCSSPALIRSLFAVAFASFALACGGDDDDSAANNGATCGSGTVEINGQCVPGGECGEGTHSEGGKCVANGGNAGASGSGGSSGSSGSGGSTSGGSAGNGGSAGTAGVAGQSGAGGTGAAGAGGTAGTTGGAGTGGSSAQGGSGNLQPGDEPCPAEPFLNCSDSCGEQNAELCAGTCFTEAQTSALIDFPPVSFPYVVRTPSHPGTDPLCVERCGEGDTVYGFRFKIDFPFTPDPNGHSPLNLRYTVEEPWIISADGAMKTGVLSSEKPWYCVKNFWPISSGSGCVQEISDPPVVLYVVTLDPDAPARNVTVELVPSTEDCPP